MLKLLIFISAFLLSGCVTKVAPPKHHISKTKRVSPSYIPKEKNWITTALYREYKKWYRTPYKYGGLSKNGIDCSSLIQQIYRDAFNISIPRTTKAQAKKGYFVKRNNIKEGDLVFFKTSYKVRHVGVIIEKEKFIHTSQKYGVSISSLNNPYWRSKYWQSRRVLP